MNKINKNLIVPKGWDWTSVNIEKTADGKINALMHINSGNEKYIIKASGLPSTMWLLSWELENEYDLALFTPGTKDQFGNKQKKYIFGFQNEDEELANLTSCDLIEIQKVR